MTQKQFWTIIIGFGAFLAANVIVWLLFGAWLLIKGV